MTLIGGLLLTSLIGIGIFLSRPTNLICEHGTKAPRICPDCWKMSRLLEDRS